MILRYINILCHMLFILPSWAQSHVLSKDLESILTSTKTTQADFSQVLTDTKGNQLQTSNGSMAIERPGKFRWDIKSPMKQLIIADGSFLWIYDTDLEQVTKKKL